MKQSNARVSSWSAASSKHGVRQQRKPCQLSPIFRLVLGTTKSQLLDESSDDREGMSDQQELISSLDSRTLRALNVLGLLHFSNITKNAIPGHHHHHHDVRLFEVDKRN